MEKTLENESNASEKEITAPVIAQMPESNGVRQPRENTHCARIWTLATKMSTDAKATVAVGDLIEVATGEGYNEATIKTQYARWRKFHGIEGRVESAKAREAKAKAAELKAAKLQEKEAAKLAKIEEKKSKAIAKAEAAEAKAKLKAELAAEKLAAKEAKEAEKEAAKAAKIAAKKEADAEAAAKEAAKAAAEAAKASAEA